MPAILVINVVHVRAHGQEVIFFADFCSDKNFVMGDIVQSTACYIDNHSGSYQGLVPGEIPHYGNCRAEHGECSGIKSSSSVCMMSDKLGRIFNLQAVGIRFIGNLI